MATATLKWRPVTHNNTEKIHKTKGTMHAPKNRLSLLNELRTLVHKAENSVALFEVVVSSL